MYPNHLGISPKKNKVPSPELNHPSREGFFPPSTPKWMVYNGNPIKNGWFGGKTHHFRKPPNGASHFPLPPLPAWWQIQLRQAHHSSSRRDAAAPPRSHRVRPRSTGHGNETTQMGGSGGPLRMDMFRKNEEIHFLGRFFGKKLPLFTLQGTKISFTNCILKMIFPFPRWDM